MGDMGEFWNDIKPAMKEASKERRRANRENSADMLRACGIEFESRNGGAHLIVKGRLGQTIDFWPGTGKFIVRKPHRTGRGVRQVMKIANPKEES